MEKYIRIEVIEAEPMTSEEFNRSVRSLYYSGNDKNGYKIVCETGEVYWMPKAAFEKIFKQIKIGVIT